MLKWTLLSYSTFQKCFRVHSKKYPYPGKLKLARKPSRKPFLFSKRVSGLAKRLQKNPVGFRDLGNIKIFESTEFDTPEVFQNIFLLLLETLFVVSKTVKVFQNIYSFIKLDPVSEEVSNNTFSVSELFHRKPKGLPSFRIPKKVC